MVIGRMDGSLYANSSLDVDSKVIFSILHLNLSFLSGPSLLLSSLFIPFDITEQRFIP